MQYVPPLGATDPNASYVEGNPAAGLRGSFPTASGYEGMMREICDAITGLGIVPDPTNLSQLTAAIRLGGKVVACNDESTAANVFLLQGVPTIAGYSFMQTFVFVPAFTLTAAGQVNVDGKGLLTLTRPDGSPSQAGDVVKGKLIQASYDGIVVRLHSIPQATKTIGASTNGGLAVDSNGNLLLNSDNLPVESVFNANDKIALFSEEAENGLATGTPFATSIGALAAYLTNLHSGDDTSTTANQIVVGNLVPPITSYARYQRHQIKLANSITGSGATVTLSGLSSSRTLVRADGSPTQANDGLAGQILDVLDDGTRLQIVGLRTSFLPSSSAVSFLNSTTWTPPAGVTVIKRIRCWAPGGGGGGSYGSGSGGSGGGGGGYAESLNVSVAANTAIQVTIGSPGVGGTGSGGNGSAGGTTSFGSYVSATGGGGGGGGVNGIQTQVSGQGGQGSGNSLSQTGSAGGLAFAVGSGIPGSGIGGAAPFGGGSPSLNIATAGFNGNGPGGGANGGSQGGAGGNGAPGLILIEY